jgi:DNA-binding response OmpR family regulator
MAPRVLVVEDDPDLAYLFRLVLEEAGYGVGLAGSVGEARQRLDGPPVDAALLDHVLPDGSGRDLTAEFKARWPGCPVLLITALTPRPPEAPERRRVPRGPEPDAVLLKPFDLDALVEALARLLRHPPPTA